MCVDPVRACEFSDRLIEWFWSQGVQRDSIYTLSPSDWLRTLYKANETLRQAEASGRDLRPAFALWGPSQSGKSTLLSNFLDQKVWSKLRPNPDEWEKLADAQPVDGTASALYWPGSDPCIFLCDLPQSEQHRAEHVVTMNPFTGGRDASAVLTRFTRGSLREEEGFAHLEFTQFPVELKLLGPKQLLHALALGYETECYGMPRKLETWVYVKRSWNREEFVREIESFEQLYPVAATVRPDRVAYQIMYDLCEVLEDMVLSGVDRFESLMTSARNPGEWHGLIQSLLARKSLITSADKAREFAGRLLWDASPCISEQYSALLKTLSQLLQDWGSRKILCSLKAASWLLNMDAYHRITNHPESFPGLMVYRGAEHVFLAMADQPKPLVECERMAPCKDASQFARLQGLIWEMIMPINMENLPGKLENGQPNTFKDFLEKGDLLDFPGVSNIPRDKAKPLVAWPKEDLDSDLRKELEPEQLFDDSVFFSKVLKHGKTASIVSAYAKRLKIDGFTIFMYLNQHPPPNAGQLISGINTWWNRMVPDYNRQLGGRSPLPLNLALTWWRDLFENYSSLRLNGGEYFASKQELLSSLGRVSNPGVLWSTCALNYYRLPQGRPSRNSMSISELVGLLCNEPDFKAQFATPESRASFESMLDDHQTGGAAFLCRLLGQQLGQLLADGQRNRQSILEEVQRTQTEELQRLLQGEFMFPPPVPRDLRKEHLKRFKDGMEKVLRLDSSTERRGVGPERETEMRRLNHALRQLLNVDYTDLEILPSASHEITEEFILAQYRTWIRKQTGRWSPEAAGSSAPEWHLLGIANSTQVEAYLTSMMESLKPQIKETAEWLRELRGEHDDLHRIRRVNYLPFLALRMSNLLVGNPGSGYVKDLAPSYQVLVKPFIEVQLPRLMDAPVGAKSLVPVPGTAELRKLCAVYDIGANGSEANRSLPEAA